MLPRSPSLPQIPDNLPLYCASYIAERIRDLYLISFWAPLISFSWFLRWRDSYSEEFIELVKLWIVMLRSEKDFWTLSWPWFIFEWLIFAYSKWILLSFNLWLTSLTSSSILWLSPEATSISCFEDSILDLSKVYSFINGYFLLLMSSFIFLNFSVFYLTAISMGSNSWSNFVFYSILFWRSFSRFGSSFSILSYSARVAYFRFLRFKIPSLSFSRSSIFFFFSDTIFTSFCSNF